MDRLHRERPHRQKSHERTIRLDHYEESQRDIGPQGVDEENALAWYVVLSTLIIAWLQEAD